MNQDDNYKEEQLQEESNTVEQTENSLSQSSVEQSRSPVLTVENSSNSVSFPMANSSENTNAEGSILNPESVDNSPEYNLAAQRVAQLQRTEESLKEEISNLQASYKTLQAEVGNTQKALSKMTQEALSELEQRKQTLLISIEQLERRQERIRNEMRTTFAGASQELAIRVQGFKDYLTGSLQDLAAAAEQLELVPPTKLEPPKTSAREVEPDDEFDDEFDDEDEYEERGGSDFGRGQFQDTTRKIRQLIDQYRTKPDYYGPPWQLRRTFEPVHAERVSNWFFKQAGRGALRTMGSRLQNTLIASAIISVLHSLYGNRVRTLVLANSPERLGEWRRGLQDCLGIGRPDFGPDRGLALFETPSAVAQKAERLVKAGLQPLIIIDDSEEQINVGLLQFPLWLAFAPDPKMMRDYYEDEFF
ncbi:Protein of unknown function (DUF3086) [Rivularia sp. PCC 7116]|uniref:DUF3086 domain-containing protein n=1 Tax=Rivularia sp. PCC 7116 TaxID=373994 RepID=UPI00029F4E7F|nr:DUF3086 domain-containing protein [Rivularia sp. PCC 7116]AFY58296.1 Protein of unknown function (DUF3086) [Rivularia sp. PCC 7116]